MGVTVAAGRADERKRFEDAVARVRLRRRKPMWIAGGKGCGYRRVGVWCERRGVWDVIR